MRTSGENKNNETAGATDRPELFQEADGAEAREVVAECRNSGAGGRLDCIARAGAGFASVFERKDERAACCSRERVRGVPCADGRRLFSESKRQRVLKLPRRADAPRRGECSAWLRQLPFGAPRWRKPESGNGRKLRKLSRRFERDRWSKIFGAYFEFRGRAPRIRGDARQHARSGDG